MNGFKILLALLLLCSTGAAMASEADIRLDSAPAHRRDSESLQRGARNFVNYCLNCHGAQYMRYNRLTDLGLTTQQIQDNLMFSTDKIGSTMASPMGRADAAAWLGAAPPDLSVEARVRSKDWLYSYLTAFYRDDKSPTGWNNLVFNNVGMPHVLWNLSGTNRLVETEFDDRERAEAAAIAAKALALAERSADGKFVVKTLALETPGTMTPLQYQTFVADLVNYLDYMSEPSRNERVNMGIAVLIFLGVLFTLIYALKRMYWKDVH